jgi:hypothetical protein
MIIQKKEAMGNVYWIGNAQDQVVAPKHPVPLKLYQVFDVDEPLELVEALYVSDWSTEDHYTIDHSKNKGSFCAKKKKRKRRSLKIQSPNSQQPSIR